MALNIAIINHTEKPALFDNISELFFVVGNFTLFDIRENSFYRLALQNYHLTIDFHFVNSAIMCFSSAASSDFLKRAPLVPFTLASHSAQVA